MAEKRRSTIAHFLDTTPQATARSYKLIGAGVADMSMAYNPSTEEVTYVHENTATVLVNNYAPKMPAEQTVYPGDSIYDYIDAIRQAGPSIGANDLTTLIEVREYETPETDGVTYPASKWNVSIQIDSFGGAGNGYGKISYTINIKGDLTDGTFNTTTKAFTATP